MTSANLKREQAITGWGNSNKENGTDPQDSIQNNVFHSSSFIISVLVEFLISIEHDSLIPIV